MSSNLCPCGSNNSFEICCAQYLSGDTQAPTAEALMRSRYTAYVKKNMYYLEQTTDPQALAEMDLKANRKWAEESEFTGLEVLRSSEEKNKGLVEFKATFRMKDAPEIQTHHELSTFRKQAGVWYFRSGKILST